MQTVVDHFLSHESSVHFTFDHGNGHTREYPGPQLAAEAAGLALHFRRLGVLPGDRVAVVVPTSEPLLRTIVAAWFARAAIVVLPHRLGGARSAASANKLQRMIAKVSPRIVVGYAEVEATVRATLGADQHYLAAEALGDIGPAAVDDTMRPRPEDLALLQFSSGSTREPRAVVLNHHNVLENSRSSGLGAGIKDDIVCIWLPIFHDFGMLGGVLFPMTFGLKARLLPSEVFANDPIQWLIAMTETRATLSACPPSILDVVCLNLLRHPQQGDVNLHSLRYMSIGGEPIFPRRFFSAASMLEKLGLSRTALQPAYGMAEAVAGITNGNRGSTVRTAASGNDQESAQFLSCGFPIPDLQINIRNEVGDPIPQPARGHIWIKGPSVTKGYWGEAESPLRDGWLDTGDEGFLLDGQLYVCGRSKDTLIRGGVNYDAHEIEDAVLQALDTHAPELRCRAVAVFVVRDEDQQRERVVAMLELRRPPPDPDTLFDHVRAAVLERTGLGLDDLAHCPSLPRTTSGKLQRNLARELYLDAVP